MMEDSPRLSKSVRSLVQLKDFLITFMRCEIGDGQDALFWFDSWTELGPLLTYVGDSGPRRLCLRLSATVADATRNGTWNLPSARTQQIETQQIFMTTIPPPDVSFGKDKYLWLQSDGSFGPSFSTKGTWDHIRESSPIQSWSKILWFKEQIPRNSFISWLVMLRRLSTRDRLRRWGMMCLSSVCYVALELRLTITSFFSVIIIHQSGCILLAEFGLTRRMMSTQQPRGLGSLEPEPEIPYSRIV